MRNHANLEEKSRIEKHCSFLHEERTKHNQFIQREI